MSTEREILRAACGVVLTRMDLVHGGTVVSRAYHLKTLRTPETWVFSSLAEADAAYIDEVNESEASDVVARRLRSK